MLISPEPPLAMTTLRDAAIALIATMPALSAFVPVPDDLTFVDRPPHPVPGVAHLLADCGATDAGTETFVQSVRQAAPFADWQQTYTEAQVGADFLARYGWIELWGPQGHFFSATARAYVAFWGAGLDYDWHWHEAEELYLVVSGGALFRAKDMPDAALSAGDTRLHLSNQPHAMQTGKNPILTLVLWRGPGLDGVPHMPDPAA